MGRKKAPKRPDLAKEMFLGLMERSFAMQSNPDRAGYSPWFKEMIVKAKKEGMSYEELNDLTNIPVKTLENFKLSVEDNFPKKKA